MRLGLPAVPIVALALTAVAVAQTDAPSAPDPSANSTAAVCEARDELDRIDGRRPVPLLPQMAHHQKTNMRDHLLAVQEIVAGLAASDFVAVRSAAERIGTSDRMRQMCTHMGAGAPGFTDLALRFHETADGIAAAAAAEDREAVTRALSETLQTCNACHATFRQHVVDEGSWSESTGSSAPPGLSRGQRRGPGPHGPRWSEH